jgi:hypothetical protein
MVELLGNESVKISNTKPPTEDPCTEDAVQLTAKELNQMSMQEREQILYDVHGISEKAFDETPDFLARKLKEFQKVLDTTRHNTAYDLALRTNPDFVTNQKFRLAFLRTDQFNADKAVNRWIRHFEAKLDLFGEALLCKHIEQDDLDQETLKCLYSGWQQDLPLRDVSGRLVTILFTKLRDENMPVLQKVNTGIIRRNNLKLRIPFCIIGRKLKACLHIFLFFSFDDVSMRQWHCGKTKKLKEMAGS